MHTLPVAKLCNVLVELHDLGFADDIILGQVIAPCQLLTLYPGTMRGWYDLEPRNATTGDWRSSSDSCPVIEMVMEPAESLSPSAPPLLESLFSLPPPQTAQALRRPEVHGRFGPAVDDPAAATQEVATVATEAVTEAAAAEAATVAAEDKGPAVQGPAVASAAESAEAMDATTAGATTAGATTAGASTRPPAPGMMPTAPAVLHMTPMMPPTQVASSSSSAPSNLVGNPLAGNPLVLGPVGASYSLPATVVSVGSSSSTGSAQGIQILPAATTKAAPKPAPPILPAATTKAPPPGLQAATPQVQRSVHFPVSGPEVGPRPADTLRTQVELYFHELAVDTAIWHPMWSIFDNMATSLIDGSPVPGVLRGQEGLPPAPPSVQGLALGFNAQLPIKQCRTKASWSMPSGAHAPKGSAPI